MAPDRQLLNVIRKSDLRNHVARTKDVCRIEDGNTNSYLVNNRAVEDFLTRIEPNYNQTLQRVLLRDIDQEVVFVLSGLLSYILSCSPTAIRLGEPIFRKTVEMTTALLDRSLQLPRPPEILGASSLAELINTGKVTVNIDEKYPQAVGITTLLSKMASFGNSRWEFLVNPFDDSPYFASDFPVAAEVINANLPVNRIMPLSPKIAVRVLPDMRERIDDPQFSFKGFKYQFRTIGRSEATKINRLLVQCAEDSVFFLENHEWVPRLIEKNRNSRLENNVNIIPANDGQFLLAQLRIDSKPLASPAQK